MSFSSNLKNIALICVDLQAGGLTGSDLPIVGAVEMMPKAKKILTAARLAKLPIVHFKLLKRIKFKKNV